MITLEELLISLLLYISEGLAIFHVHKTSNNLVYTERVNNLEKNLKGEHKQIVRLAVVILMTDMPKS